MTRSQATVLVPHALAVILLGGLAWFIRELIRGDVAMWIQDLASFLVIAIGLTRGPVSEGQRFTRLTRLD